MKWIVSTIVTIILVPKFQPFVAEYIESQFINNVGLGVLIFIFTLFVTILVGKILSRTVTWTGVGSISYNAVSKYVVFEAFLVRPLNSPDRPLEYFGCPRWHLGVHFGSHLTRFGGQGDP